MHFPFIDATFTSHLVNALCNTLVHSLWQGILLAAAAGLIVLATRRTTTALRYNLLVSALTIFAAGVVLTFVLQFLNSTPTIVINPASDEAILADMVKDGIIISPNDNLSFRLTKNWFLLNGIKQNDDIIKRYKEKYVPAEADDDYVWSHQQHFPD